MPVNEQGQGSPANLEALINKILSDREENKKQRQKIDQLAKDMAKTKELICDASGRCKLVEKRDLERIEKQQAEIDPIKRAVQEIEKKWDRMSPEEREKLPLIPTKAHRTMFNLIFGDGSPSRGGAVRRVLKNTSLEEWQNILKEDPKIMFLFVRGLCTSPEECKIEYNKMVDSTKKETKGGKASWLIKEKK